MEDKNQNMTVVDGGETVTPVVETQPTPMGGDMGHHAPSHAFMSGKLVKLVLLSLLAVLLLGGSAFAYVVSNTRRANDTQLSSLPQADGIAIQQISLGDMASVGNAGLVTNQTLSVNGQLKVNNSLVLSPISQPSNVVLGQIYFDAQSNGLAYYDGSKFVTVANSDQIATLRAQAQSQTTQLGGLTSRSDELAAGLNGLAARINSTPAVPTDIARLGSSNVFTAGNSFAGLLTAADVSVNGATSIQGGLSVAGNATLSNTSVNNLSVAGNATLGSATASSLVLSSALDVSSGGTGTATLTANGVVIGNGTGPLATITASSTGLCLMSTSGAPTFQACPGGVGASGVTSLNGLDGVLTLSDTISSGTSITINTATTTARGLASFNASNFTVTGGSVNTIQNISVSSTPTFAGLNLNSSLSVNSGGTGANSLTANGVIIGNGTSALTSVTASLTGLCLISTSGAPTFQTCPSTSIPANVSSLNGLTGALTINNTTGSGSTLTINDATTSAKGIASFNSANFTVSGGAVDTVQNISSTAAPTFAGINTGQITASSGLTVSTSSNQNITLATSGTGALYLSGYNCSVLAGGGKLTVDGSGKVNCAADTDTDTGITSIVAGNGISVVNTNEVSVQLQSGYGLAFDAANPFGLGLQACATNQILKSTGSGWVCAADMDTGGGGGVTTIGAFDSGTANANGASISGSTLYLQSASNSFAGLVNTVAQTFAGAKTFGVQTTFAGGLSISSGQNLTLGTTCTTGQVLTTNGSGQVICANDDTGTDSGVTVVGAVDGRAKSANGAVIDGNTIYLQTADATNPGLIGNGAQAFAGAKTFNSQSTFAAGLGLASDQSIVGAGNLTVSAATNANLSLTTSGTGSLYFLGYNCSTSANGGKLTVDGSGKVLCANDTDTDTNTTNVIAGNGISVTGGDTVSVQLRNGYGLAFDAVNPHGVGLTSCATNEILKSNGSGWDCANDVDTGDGQGITTIGALDGGTANANGASIGGGGSTLYLQSASALNGGLVNTSAQTFAGAKTFNAQVTFSSGLTVAAGQTTTIGTACTAGQVLTSNASRQLTCVTDDTGADTGVTTVGGIDSQTKSANGAVISGSTIYLQNADASNVGLVSTGAQTFGGLKTFGAGATITAGQNLTLGTICTTGQVLTTNSSGVVTCTADNEGTDTGVTTVGTVDTQTKSANGAVIVGNTVYLQTADASSIGLVSTGSQTFAGAKSFNGAASFAAGASVTGNLGVSGTINSATISGGSLTGGAFSGGTVTGGSLTATTVNGLTVSSSAITAPVALTVSVANNQNLTLATSGTGSLYFSGYNCSTYAGGGKLTVTASGQVGCADDTDTDSDTTTVIAGNGISVTGGNTVSVQLRNGYGLAFDAVSPYGVGLTSCATNEILKSNGSGWDCASDVDTGDGQGVTAIGALDGGTANANGASIGGGGSTLYLQSASGVRNGIVTTNAQTFAGAKTFSGGIAANAGITIASGQSLTLGTTCSAGQVLTTNGSGVVTCVADADTDTGVTTVGTVNSQTKSANGAVIVGSTIYLQTADASSIGLVSTGAQTFAGAKTFNGAASFAAGASVTGNLGVSGTINSATISGGSLTGGTFSGGTISGGTLTASAVNGLSVSASAITAPAALTVTTANNQNLTLATSGTGSLYFSGYNCSASANGGKLTVDATGKVNCAADIDTDTNTTNVIAGNGISVTGGGNTVSVQLRNGYGLAFDAVSPYGVGLTSCATNEILKSNGSGWDCANDVDTGDGQGITTIGALDGGTTNANGASIGGGGSTLYLQSASGVRNGIVTTNAQTFAGAKTFSGSIAANAGIVIASGQNLTLGTACAAGQVLTTNGSGVVSCTTDAGVTAVGAIDSQTKSVNGAVIVGNTIYLQTADASNDGLVSTGAQTFAGAKTFSNLATLNAGLTATGALNFNTTGTAANNIGNLGSALSVVGNGASASTGVIAVRVAGDANERFTVRADGQLVFQNAAGTSVNGLALGAFNNLNSTGNFSVGATNGAGGRLSVVASGATNVAQVIRGVASQSADLLQFQNSAGTVLSGYNSLGQRFMQSGSFAGTFVQGTLTANRTYTLPDADGVICLQGSTNCGFAAASGSANYIQNQSASAQAANFNIAAASGVAAVIQGAAGQNIVEYKTSAGTTISSVSQFGRMTANGATFSTSTGVSDTNTIIAHSNTNTSATASTTVGLRLTVIGTNNANVGANTLNALYLNNVTAATNNTFNGIYAGTGYSSILNYNGTSLVSGTGKLQNAALDSTVNYSNLQNVTNLTATGNVVVGGTIALQSGTFTSTINQATLSQNQTITIPASSVANDTVCLLNLQNCVGTGSSITGSGTANYVARFTGGQALGTGLLYDNGSFVGVNTTTNNGTLSIQGATGQTGLTVQGASGQDIAQFKNSAGTTLLKVDANGRIDSSSSASFSRSSSTTGNSLYLQMSATNTSATASSVDGQVIKLFGINNANVGANTLNGLRLDNVTAATNNTFNGLYFGTGYTSLLNYNGTSLINGTGQIQNAAFDPSQTYSNLQNVGTINATGYSINGSAGTNFTCGAGQVATNFTVTSGITTTGTCTTVAPASGSANYIQNQSATAQLANLYIQGTTTGPTATIRGALNQTVASFKTSDGTDAVTIDSTGQLVANRGLYTTAGTYIEGDGSGYAGSLSTIIAQNTNTTSSNRTINAQDIALQGTANNNGGNNVTNALNFRTVNAATNNTFNGLYFGTGYTSLLNYNGTSLINGTGQIQNATFDPATNYSNLRNLTNLTVSGTLNSVTGYQTNGVSGANTTCTGGQFIQNQVIQGGLTTGGTCATPAGDGGVTTVGALDGGTPNGTGATISGNTLYLQSASASNAGLVNTGSQTFAGAKSFSGATTFTTDSSTALMIQNSSLVNLFTADTTNMRVVIGTGGNTITLSTTGLELAGNARKTKVIRLSAEYAGTVLDAGTMSNNNGSMSSGLDLTNRMNYYKWTTSQNTNQSYDIVVQVPVPSDFSAWSSGTPLTIATRTSNVTNGTITLEARDTGGNVETNCNFASVTPATTGAWETNTSSCQVAGTYTAGDYMTLRIRVQSPNAGDVRVGNITMTYRAKF